MSLYETRTHSSSLIHFMVFKKISVSHPVPQTRKNSIPKTPSLLLATMIKAHCLPLHAFVGIPTWIIDVKLNISLLPLFSSSSNQNGFSRLNSPVWDISSTIFNHLQPTFQCLQECHAKSPISQRKQGTVGELGVDFEACDAFWSGPQASSFTGGGKASSWCWMLQLHGKAESCDSKFANHEVMESCKNCEPHGLMALVFRSIQVYQYFPVVWCDYIFNQYHQFSSSGVTFLQAPVL